MIPADSRARPEEAVQFPLPPTSLILCSRNRPELLCQCVQSILNGAEVPSELVIVDDSDVPNARLQQLTTGRAAEIRYFWTRARGLSRANNDGIAAARHAILVFTQDDVLVTPSWFGTLVRSLITAGPRCVVTGMVPPVETAAKGRFSPSTITDAEARVYNARTGEGVLYIQNMAMYRSTFQMVDRFDERLGPGTAYPSAEDNDYAYRLLKAGYQIVYCPKAIVYHQAWRTGEQYLPLRWNYGVGRGAVYAKHARLRDRFMLRQMLWDIRVHLQAIAGKIHRDRQQALGDFILALGIGWGALRWLVMETK